MLVVVTLLEVIKKEEGVVALYLHIGPLKTRSELEPVLRCEPSSYQPINRCAIGVGKMQRQNDIRVISLLPSSA